MKPYIIKKLNNGINLIRINKYYIKNDNLSFYKELIGMMESSQNCKKIIVDMRGFDFKNLYNIGVFQSILIIKYLNERFKGKTILLLTEKQKKIMDYNQFEFESGGVYFNLKTIFKNI